MGKGKLQGFIKDTKPIWILFQPNIKTIAYIYVLAVVLVLRSNFDTLCATQICDVLNMIYDTITQNNLINLFTSILLVISGGYFAHRISKGKIFSWLLILVLFTVIYLMTDSYWIWAKSVFWLDYRWLLVLTLSCICICGIIPLGKKIKNTPIKSKNTSKVSGFSVTTEKGSLQDTGWSQYAKNLVSKLLKTDLSTESFAVGVSGVWGSGKSTFLSAIKEEICKHVYLLNFNPWNSDSVNQISDDFFKTLLSQLSIFLIKSTQSLLMQNYWGN